MLLEPRGSAMTSEACTRSGTRHGPVAFWAREPVFERKDGQDCPNSAAARQQMGSAALLQAAIKSSSIELRPCNGQHYCGKTRQTANMSSLRHCEELFRMVLNLVHEYVCPCV